MSENVEAEIKVKLIQPPYGFKSAVIDMQSIHLDLCEIVKYETFIINKDSFVAQQECRWYTIDEDMKKISEKYKGVLFSVKWNIPAYGEDNTVDYFYEGKTHRAVITYSPFDKSLLK